MKLLGGLLLILTSSIYGNRPASCLQMYRIAQSTEIISEEEFSNEHGSKIPGAIAGAVGATLLGVLMPPLGIAAGLGSIAIQTLVSDSKYEFESSETADFVQAAYEWRYNNDYEAQQTLRVFYFAFRQRFAPSFWDYFVEELPEGVNVDSLAKKIIKLDRQRVICSVDEVNKTFSWNLPSKLGAKVYKANS